MENEELQLFEFDGAKHWRLKGELHREDGPAIEWTNGDRVWWVNGQRHRIDGPAKILHNGTKEWWINDKQISYEDWKSLYSPFPAMSFINTSTLKHKPNMFVLSH